MARGAPSGSSSRMSRWRPTPAQLMVLQELFMRRGVRTPTALQIQRITQQLKEFGKVETKNVFYWFQNHKAREKQKLRKTLHSRYQQHPNFLYYCLPPTPEFNSCGVLPFIPAAQMTRGNYQVVEIATADNSSDKHRNGSITDYQKQYNDSVSANHRPHDANDGSSGWEIMWINDVAIDSTSRKAPPLKTLQLFPTSSSSSSSSSMSSN